MEYVTRHEEAAAGGESLSDKVVLLSDRANFDWKLRPLFSKNTGWSYYSDTVVLLLPMAKICRVIWTKKNLLLSLCV